MKKTLNINLGGLAFVIDENAFELLHNYLETLKRKFDNETERDEILNDIEARIGEMLHLKLADRKEVIGVDDVQQVINAMGKPEDIAGEETSNTNSSTTFTEPAAQKLPIKKRLYRDPDDAKVGGVISGLCHYFGIDDPTWARIAVILLCFVSFGTMIVIYFLLLIVVPKAVSSTEKLQMKGEPVNINTIEKEIKDAANRAGESVHKFVGERNFFERLGDIITSVIRAFFKLLLAFAVFISVVLLIAVFVAFVVFYFLGSSQFNEATSVLVNDTHTITYFSFGFLLFLGIPLVGVIYSGFKVFLGYGSNIRWPKWVFFGSWLVGVLLLLLSVYKTGINFREENTKREQATLMQPATGMLYVQLSDTTGKKVNKDDEENLESFNLDEDGIIINGVNLKDMERIPVAKPDLEIMPSENDSFYMQQIVSSMGRNKADAAKNAEAVIYSFSQTDSILNLTPSLYINKNSKWRVQEMKIRIAIPEGMKIRFADNIDLWHAIVKGDRNFDDTYFANTTWTTEGGKLKCIAGENHFNAEKGEEVIQEDVMQVHGKKLKKQIRVLKETEKKQDEEDKDDKDKDF
jgi:phage shock protein PspC (stress-responsive transcriptional regulator)